MFRKGYLFHRILFITGVRLRNQNYVILFHYVCLYVCSMAHVESDVNLRQYV